MSMLSTLLRFMFIKYNKKWWKFVANRKRARTLSVRPSCLNISSAPKRGMNIHDWNQYHSYRKHVQMTKCAYLLRKQCIKWSYCLFCHLYMFPVAVCSERRRLTFLFGLAKIFTSNGRTLSILALFRLATNFHHSLSVHQIKRVYTWWTCIEEGC